MTASLADLVIGPAVIVDDKIFEADGALQAILSQLEGAGLPIVSLDRLPSIESLVHWRQLSLIVLDWELSFSEGESVEIPSGVTVPTVLGEVGRSDVREFIRALMLQTVAPVFILSHSNVESIREELFDSLDDLHDVLARRVMVCSKSEVEVDLLNQVREWITSRPALVALKAWNRAYVDAETATFQDFDQASGNWVAAVYAAAREDGVQPDAELREILVRNVINRVGKIDFFGDEGILGDSPAPGPELRRVLNRGAVIPARSLADSGLSTGDLFVEETASTPYERIYVLVSPDCELVRREQVRLTYLTAEIVEPGKKQSKARVERVRRGGDGEVWSCLLTPAGDEYRIQLTSWQVKFISPGDGARWEGYSRIGRLMEPYVSHLQQNFALNISRKGLPRVPHNFFEG